MKPTNLEECFIELKKMLSEDDIFFIKQNVRNVNYFHHSVGRKIRNKWGLWENSELKSYFEKIGLHHPDDMSGLILKSFHYHLNNLPLRLDEQIEHYREYWKHVSENNNISIFFEKDNMTIFDKNGKRLWSKE